MQPDVLSPEGLSLRSAAELKAIFRGGWSAPERVEGWFSSSLNSEFWDPECREAWKDALDRAVADVPPGPVLDCGTGPGTISLMWAELGHAVTGIDFSPTMLEMARRVAAEHGLRAKFMEGDAESLPFKGEQFSIVSARFLLFTLPNPGYAIRRWVELLEPGGALVIVGHDFHPGVERQPEERPKGPSSDTRVGWQITEEYKGALAELPFMDHKRGHVQVVMEAAGLKNIRSVPIDDLIRARTRYAETQERPVHSTPYILVGRK